uniref:hypothetical protein n=1 Tax=Brevundimonas sp. TaxID=1871086 RepID=UPI0028AE0EC1
ARQAHNLKVVGSNPTPAPTSTCDRRKFRSELVPATISTCDPPVLVAGVLLLSDMLFGVSAFGTDLGLRIMEGLGLVAVT